MKRQDNQQIVQYAEKFKGLANHYLMLTNAPNASVTSEQLAHLMLTNVNLSSDVHASPIMRLTAIVSEKGQSSQVKVLTTTDIQSTLANAFDGLKDHLSTVLDLDSGDINSLLSCLASAVSNVQKKLQYFPRDGLGEEGCMPRATLNIAYAVLQDIPQPAQERKAEFRTLLSAQPIISKDRHLQKGRFQRRRPSGGCYDCGSTEHKQGSLSCKGPSLIGRKIQEEQWQGHNAAPSRTLPDTLPPTNA